MSHLWNLGKGSGQGTQTLATLHLLPLCCELKTGGSNWSNLTGDLQDSEGPHLKGGGHVPEDDNWYCPLAPTHMYTHVQTHHLPTYMGFLSFISLRDSVLFFFFFLNSYLPAP